MVSNETKRHHVKAFEEARDAFRQSADCDTAKRYRETAYRLGYEGGTEEYPSGYPSDTKPLDIMPETADVMRGWLAGCPWDIKVTITLDANKLASLLNTAQGRLAAQRPSDFWVSDQWHVIEALRDALARARYGK